jgi:hypothetical protein
MMGALTRSITGKAVRARITIRSSVLKNVEKMLNHQHDHRMEMQVYPKTRSGSGDRQGIGKNKE